MKFEILFLGTGDAVPTAKRNHPGFLVSFANENILVDCGEGMQRQFRIAGVTPMRLTKILLTHLHGDHVFGLPGLLRTLVLLDYPGKLNVYGPRWTKAYLKLLEEVALTPREKLNMEVHEVSGKFVENKDYYIESMEMKHGIPANAYAIVVKDKRRLDKKKLRKLKLPNSPLLGKLQRGEDVMFNGKKIKSKDVCYVEKGKKIVFIMDTGMNENAVKIAREADLLVCESTFMGKDIELAKERNHLTALQAAGIAKKARVKKLVLTHISQRYEKNLDAVLKEARKVFKNSILARDFDKVVV